jgi:hypothetical protein
MRATADPSSPVRRGAWVVLDEDWIPDETGNVATIAAEQTVEDIEYINLDEPQLDEDTVFRAVLEMKSRPLRLTGASAQAFLDAKRGRAPRVAKPLPLD